MLWFLLILGILAVLIAIILIRTSVFKPPAKVAGEIEEAPCCAEDIANRLAQMIRCKTVSSKFDDLVDKSEFDRFLDLLSELYPKVHKICDVERVGPSGVLFTLRGRSSDNPTVLMAHYDVVPADEGAWFFPPFEGVIANGLLWGRGTLDTKCTLCGIMEAAERLIVEGFVPKNDLFFAFSGDEEISGGSASAIITLLKKRGISPAMVLDEGGAVVEGVFPGVSQECALIGTAEKGVLDVELIIETSGGHASYPPPHTPVGLLSKAVTRIEKRPFRTRLTPPVAAMFTTLGRYSTFIYRLVFANLWCFRPLVSLMCGASGELNAMMRTTCAFTMMQGSNAPNVLPPLAKMVANLRIIGGESPDTAVEYLRSVVANDSIVFNKINSTDPSKDSLPEGDGWDAIRGAVEQTWPGAIVSPYLMYAASDSRHYCEICEHVFRFSPMKLSTEERATIHGHNERIPLDTLKKIAQFYTRLMRKC